MSERGFTDEEVFAASRGELDPKRTRELIDRAARDPECAESWRLARAIAEESGPEAGSGARAEQAAVLARRRWGFGLGTAAAAASILLAVVLTPLVREAPVPDHVETPDGPVVRDGDPIGTDTDGPYEIESLTPPDAPLPRGAFLLEWTPGPEGTLWTVELVDLDMTPVAVARRLDQPHWVVPADALAGVDDGATLLWRVEAELADGRGVESPAFRARLANGE